MGYLSTFSIFVSVRKLKRRRLKGRLQYLQHNIQAQHKKDGWYEHLHQISRLEIFCSICYFQPEKVVYVEMRGLKMWMSPAMSSHSSYSLAVGFMMMSDAFSPFMLSSAGSKELLCSRSSGSLKYLAILVEYLHVVRHYGYNVTQAEVKTFVALLKSEK